MDSLIKGGLRGDRHPPYQGGQGGSNLKSIFNLIITSYLITVPISLEIAEVAAQLRARQNLRTPDAIQIATAMGEGAK
jgi:predicted nucleic acid-binding protein